MLLFVFGARQLLTARWPAQWSLSTIGLSRQWVHPAQAGKPRKITVIRAQSQSMFDGKCVL
jgi:hypothetical protein